MRTNRAYSSDVAFTPTVKAIQARKGSRDAYGRVEEKGGWRTRITPDLAGFIEAHVPTYRCQHFYRPQKSVRDRNVITANGLAPFAFAAEIFRALAPEREADIETYERLYSRGLLAP